MKCQTYTPVKYEDLTPGQKEEICNGCGGKGGWIKPPHRIFFKASCNHHDYGYWKGGSELDRLEADKMLYKSMVKDCKTLPWYQWVRYRPWCWAYYKGVRIAGWKFFYFSEKKRYPELN